MTNATVSRSAPRAFEDWLEALEARVLGELRFSEVRRGLQALSRVYVQRRDRLEESAALDGRGKRGAFALFYGPLHFLLTEAVLEELDAPTPGLLVDIGCGTGVGGAAWALRGGGGIEVRASDVHPWAVREAAWTYRTLGVRARVRSEDAARVRVPPGAGVVAGFVVNELDDAGRARLLPKLLDAAAAGGPVLVLEPLARRQLPWWDAWSDAFTQQGGRADTWKLPLELPQRLAELDRAAGLRHHELGGRSMYLPGSRG